MKLANGPAYLILQTANKRHQLLLNGGIGVPTGSIDEEMGGFRVDYCMQPSSGTVSLLPGLTYLGQTTTWSWGTDFKAIVRLGRNDHSYRFGNRYESRAWVMRQLASWLSISTGLNAAVWENIHGADPGLDPMMEQTTDPNLQGGKRLDASFGLTFCPMPCCHGAPCCSTALTNFLDGQQWATDYSVARWAAAAEQLEYQRRLAMDVLKGADRCCSLYSDAITSRIVAAGRMTCAFPADGCATVGLANISRTRRE